MKGEEEEEWWRLPGDADRLEIPAIETIEEKTC
jgi:hypothetical protein